MVVFYASPNQYQSPFYEMFIFWGFIKKNVEEILLLFKTIAAQKNFQLEIEKPVKYNQKIFLLK